MSHEREYKDTWEYRIATLTAENERLRGQVEYWQGARHRAEDDAKGCLTRADQAEARNHALVEALAALVRHIRRIAYRDASGLRLGPAVPAFEDAAALTEPTPPQGEQG